jgi:hypothetical protein
LGKKGLKFLPYSRFPPTASTSIVHFFGIFVFRRERKSASFGIDLRRVDGRRWKLHVVQISSYNFSGFLDPRRSGVIHPLDHLKEFFILHFSEYFGLLLIAHAFHWDHVSTLFLNYKRKKALLAKRQANYIVSFCGYKIIEPLTSDDTIHDAPPERQSATLDHASLVPVLVKQSARLFIIRRNFPLSTWQNMTDDGEVRTCIRKVNPVLSYYYARHYSCKSLISFFGYSCRTG